MGDSPPYPQFPERFRGRTRLALLAAKPLLLPPEVSTEFKLKVIPRPYLQKNYLLPITPTYYLGDFIKSSFEAVYISVLSVSGSADWLWVLNFPLSPVPKERFSSHGPLSSRWVVSMRPPVLLPGQCLAKEWTVSGHGQGSWGSQFQEFWWWPQSDAHCWYFGVNRFFKFHSQ